MLKKTTKPLALILALILVISATLIPTSIIASAATEDIDYSLFTGRHTWKFDTDAANENFQINMLNAVVDKNNGYFSAPTNWTQTQPVNYEFIAGKTYVVNFKWKLSAKPTDGFQFQLRVNDTAFKNYGWMSTVPTDWQTDRIQFTAGNTGLLKIYMNAGTGETLYIDTISIYEVGSSVRFDFSDDTQLMVRYYSSNFTYTTDETLSANVTKQWSTDFQFVPDYVIENGKKYTVTFKYKANTALTGNKFVVSYHKGTAGWNYYDNENGFVTPSLNTAAANTWYTGEFTFVANNGADYPYLDFLLRPTKVATYEFDDITICQAAGSVNLNLGDSTQTANTFGLKAGASYTLPSATKVGYALEGWYSEPEFKTAVTKVNVPAEGSSITVYAKWKKAVSYFLDFNKASDLEFGASWNGDSIPKINNNELHMRGSANANPSYARLPILLEAGTYNYSFKYRANPVNTGDTYTLHMYAGLNSATDMNSINSPYTSAKAVNIFNAAQLSTGQEYVTKTGSFVITEEMLSEGSDRLTLRFMSATRYAELYIDDLYIEKAFSADFDFAEASQVGNTYSASVTDGVLEMRADKGKQSRARLNYELKAGSYYTLTYKYRAESALDIKLAPWYARAISSGWDFLGGDNEFSYAIPGALVEYEYATTEWKTVTLNFVATGNINENYKYLGFWMQSTLDGGKIYIDDVVITERSAKVSFDTNGGNAIDDLTYLPIAESVTLETPIKENYKFVAWYYDADCTQVVGSTYVPYAGEDVVLYAKWEAKTVNDTTPAVPTVSYENGKVIIESVDGYEYKVGESDWQKSNEFADLIVGPEYTFYQRVAETASYASSLASETTFKLTPNGDYNLDGTLNSSDLVGIRRTLLNVETGKEDLIDANEDGLFDIRDLVALKKITVDVSKFFIGNDSISEYSVINNVNSYIANEAYDILKNSIESYAGSSFAETSDKNIVLSVTYQDEDNYTVSIVDGNLVFEANSDYMLLEAVNAFVSKYDSLSNVRVHIPMGFVMSGDSFKNNGSYALVWNDEFSGEALDSSKWTNDIYTTTSGENNITQTTANAAVVSDGTLKLNTYLENGIWYGSDIRTNDKFKYAYGYIEIRAKLPGTGNWASFWLNGARDENFAISNEVDIFETFGSTENNTSTVHAWTGDSATDSSLFKLETSVPNDSLSSYHTYGCLWTETGIELYTDGTLIAQLKFEDYDAEKINYLKNGGLMSVLLGNTTGYYNESGRYNYILGTPTASTFEIDYVRLYQ